MRPKSNVLDGSQGLLTVDEAMYLVGGYTSRRTFLRAMRRFGPPIVYLSPRALRFDRGQFFDWVRGLKRAA